MTVERKSSTLLLWLVLLAAAGLSLVPFLWVLAGSFKPQTEIINGRLWPWQGYEVIDPAGTAAKPPPATQPEATSAPAAERTKPPTEHVTARNYRQVFGTLKAFPTYYLNTLYLAMAGTFMALLLGSLAAYGFAQFKFWGNKPMFTLLFLSIMIPAEVYLIGQYELMLKLHLFDRLTGLLVAYTAGNLMLVIFIMRNVFVSVPQSLVEAAMMDGASTWRVFWDVMVPIGRNGLAACAILTFLNIWNEFLLALTFTASESVRTLPVGITLLKGQTGLDVGLLFATVLLSFLPIVIVFILLQKYFVRGLSAGAIKA